MKKALIISNSSGLVTSFLKNDVEILKNKGYSIECACNTKYPDNNTDEFFKQYDIKVFHVEFPIRNIDIVCLMKAFVRLKDIMKNGEYEIVHCHSTIAAALGRQCAKKYRKHGLKVIYTSHGFPFYAGNNGKKAMVFQSIEKYYSKYTDAIITICNEDYLNAKKMKCPHVFLMHGVGVDLKNFEQVNIDKKKYREKLGFKDSDKIILSVGELNTNKNHQIVIKAISELNDSNLIYAICGREVTEKGKKKELMELAQKLNVRLVFLGFRKDIPEICHIAQIGALPSYKEGLGLSGIEMLASGIPVVGSNRQGIKDYVKNGISGHLANPDNPNSFAEAIKKTFEIAQRAETEEVCKNIAKEFNVRQAYEVIEKVYRELGA